MVTLCQKKNDPNLLRNNWAFFDTIFEEKKRKIVVVSIHQRNGV